MEMNFPRPELDGYRAVVDLQRLLIRLYVDGEESKDFQPIFLMFMSETEPQHDMYLHFAETMCRLLNCGIAPHQMHLCVQALQMSNVGAVESALPLMMTRRDETHERYYKKPDGKYLRVVDDEFSEEIAGCTLEDLLSERSSDI